MKNAIVHMTYQLDLPEPVVKKILDSTMLRPDDGSDAWFQSALGAIETAVCDDPVRYLEHAVDPPDVEVDA
jgi:hypothetical protein